MKRKTEITEAESRAIWYCEQKGLGAEAAEAIALLPLQKSVDTFELYCAVKKWSLGELRDAREAIASYLKQVGLNCA